MRRQTVALAVMSCLLLGSSAARADTSADLKQTEQQLNHKAAEVQSLNDELKLLNATIAAKTAYIAELRRKATETNGRLQTINTELTGLQKLHHEAQVTLARYLRAAYVNRDMGELGVLVSDKSLSENLANASYLSSLQDYHDRVVNKVAAIEKHVSDKQQQARNNFQLVDGLEVQAQQETMELTSVQAAKQQLLGRTQNQEESFRKQFEDAKSELAKTGHFARSTRERLASRVWDDDGFYFNQLDSRWIDNKLGFSDTSTLGDYGCGVTALAMVYKYYGFATTPPQMNEALKRTSAFVDDLLDWRNAALPAGGQLQLANDPYPLGRGQVDWSFINHQLDTGNPVIVYLDRGGDLSHYVVLTDRREGGYIMHDPLEGPNLRFADHYRKDSVYQAISFSRT